AAKVRFESPWREADPATAPAGAPHAIRFKAPRDGETIVHDVVQGEVRFPNDALDDLIILRSDNEAIGGAPTYNLAVVVDDHDMDVTHVIRGDDHLNNAARQQQIYEAMGWQVPVFAHVPLIHGPDGAKLSKRHGALGVDAYAEDGYLPEGLSNYLLRLGWSHGDDEFIPREKALEWFDIAGINKAPARLDIDKLKNVNAHYIRLLTTADFVEKALPFFEKAGVDLDEARRAMLLRAAPYIKERCSTLKDAPAAAAFIVLKRPLKLDAKAAKPLEKDGARAIVKDVAALLAREKDWSRAESLETALKSFADERNLGFGEVGPALRAALTAGLPSPALGEVLYALGAAESLGRLADQAG
ncbi:MAG: glutamate--tRNA ligase, partial [Parvularculaceae bacterium]